MTPTSRRSLLGGAIALLGAFPLVTCAPSEPTAPPEPDIGGRLGPVTPLLPLYRALSRQAPVVILQIGDSHTANDSFSSRMREQFQERFGDAGRGVLPPGVPYRWYRPSRVSVDQEGWSVVSSYRGDPGPYGITGLRQHADGPAVMTLTADDPSDLDRVEVEVLRQPGGGTLDVQLDQGGHAAISTAASAPGGVDDGAIIAWQPGADAERARRRPGGSCWPGT